MKISTILIIALIATATFAQEDCKEHPWAKKDIFKKFKSEISEHLTEEQATAFQAVQDTFSKSSTAKAETDIAADVHDLLPEAWRADAKTCCTAEIYATIKDIPQIFVDVVSKNKPKFERLLAGLPMGIKKCGSKKFKHQDGEEQAPEQFNVVEMMARVFIDGEAGDGELDGEGRIRAVHILKKYFVAKARLLRSWVQFQRGALQFLCRLPSKATTAMKDGQMKLKKTSADEMTAGFKDNLNEITRAVQGMTQFMSRAFQLFGGEKCKGKATSIVSQFKNIKACKNKGCAGVGGRPLSFALLKLVIGKKADKDATFDGDNFFADGGRLRRNLQEAPATDEAGDPASVEDSDADAAANIKLDSDDQINAGGPYGADGKCVESGCDSKFEESKYAFNANGELTEGGKKNNDVEGSSAILSALVACILLLVF